MFKFDKKNPKLENGVWKDWGGSSFLIAHTSSLKFQRALARNQQPHRRKIEQGTLDPKVNQKVVATSMSEGMLLDWKDVTNEAGEVTKYTPEAGAVALQSDVEFRDWVSEVAMNLENFRQEEIEDMGNV